MASSVWPSYSASQLEHRPCRKRDALPRPVPISALMEQGHDLSCTKMATSSFTACKESMAGYQSSWQAASLMSVEASGVGSIAAPASTDDNDASYGVKA